MHRTLRRFFACIALCVLVVMSTAPSALAAQPNPVPLPKLMLRELQTGGIVNGVEDGKREFIELYNPDDIPLDVTDWHVEYLSASHTGSGAPTRILATLEGEVAPKGNVLLGYDGLIADADMYFGVGSTAASGLLARGGGHVRIVDAFGQTVDLVGWGSGTAIGNWWHAPEIPAAYSIRRILPDDSSYTNGLAFAPPALAGTPVGGGLRIPMLPPESICEGVIISELLPNPLGADAGNEFIELYNTSDQPVPLKTCSLRLGDAGKSFTLPDETLDGRAYRAFSDLETGIVLPNATAQTVWLISSGGEQGVLYPNGLGEGQAWAYDQDAWNMTVQPTPGAANSILEPEEASEESVPAIAIAAACPAGKERNPLTNRCRNAVESSASPEDCKAGYARNIETGRCKKVAVPLAALTSLSPCKAGQQRSTETNRCRSILGAATETKPCAEGQERNPDTNRCRKAASNGSSLATVQDVRATSKGIDGRWWIAGVLAAGAGGYAVYEWRQDIWQGVSKVRRRIRAKRPDG